MQASVDLLDPLRGRRALEARRMRALSTRNAARKVSQAARAGAEARGGPTVLKVIESNWSK